MKIKKWTRWSFVLLFSLGTLPSQASTNLNITVPNGTNKTISLSTLRAITFSGANLVFNYQDGSNESLPLSSIGNMTFSLQTSLDKNQPAATGKLYPNPVSQTLFLNATSAVHGDIEIFTVSGIRMMKVSGSQFHGQIDVRSLPDGFYMLKAGNDVYKFTKK